MKCASHKNVKSGLHLSSADNWWVTTVGCSQVHPLNVIHWFRWLVLCLTQLRPLSIELRVPLFLPSRCTVWNFGYTTDRHSTSKPSIWPQYCKSLASEFSFPLSLIIGHLLASCHTSLFLSLPLPPWTLFYQSPVPQYCTSPPFTHWSLSQIPIFNNDHIILHNLCTDMYTLQEIKRWFLHKTD